MGYPAYDNVSPTEGTGLRKLPGDEPLEEQE